MDVKQEHEDETTSMDMELDQLGACGHMLQDYDNQELYDESLLISSESESDVSL